MLRPNFLTRLLLIVPPLITVATLLLLWFLLGETGSINPIFLPQLPSVAEAAARLIWDPAIYADAWATAYRSAIGLLVSVALAIPVGLVFGRMPRLYAFFELPVDFFRSIPSSSLFFLFILAFGVGDTSKIAVVIYGCAPILLVGAVYGAKPSREKQDRINMLTAFGATRMQILTLGVVPDAVPQVAAAFRVSVSLSLVLVIVTEMFLGADDGLGHRLYDYYLAYRIPEMYCVLMALGLLGYLANRGAVALEHTLTFWKPLP